MGYIAIYIAYPMGSDLCNGQETRGRSFRVGRLPLLHHLTCVREVASTDPRDKVYGTLGLLKSRPEASGVPGSHPDGLIIDYQATVQDVYSSVVAELILRTKRLHLLLLGGEDRGPLVHRTWTPD